MVSNGLQSIPWHANRHHCAPLATTARGKGQTNPGAPFHYNSGNAINHREVKAMPSCVTCGKELEPPARAPHTNYVKILYQLAGQTYCRHHVIKAAVAAGVIREVRAGAGSDTSFVNPRQ